MLMNVTARTLRALLLLLIVLRCTQASAAAWKYDPYQEPITRTELLAKLKNALKLSPNEHDKLILRAQTSRLSVDAMQAYKALARKYPDNDLLQSAWALCYFRAVRTEPHNTFPEAWWKKMRDPKLFEEAREALQEPLLRIKKTDLAFCWRAAAYANSSAPGFGDTADAVERYRKSIELDPTSPGAYARLASNLLRQSKYHDARAALEASEAAIRLAPMYAAAYDVKCFALTDLGRHQEAYEALKKGTEVAAPKVANSATTRWLLDFYKKKAQAQR